MRSVVWQSRAALSIAVLLGGLLGPLSGCSKPEPPTLTPKQATVTGLDLDGVTFQLDVEAYNPNRIELSARSVTGKITLDGKHNLGTVTLAQGVKLPAGARTMIVVPLTAKWTDVAVVAGLAAERRPIPFTVDGVETLGGETFNVDVPFRMTGTITHEDLVKAASRSIPGLPQLFAPR